MLRFGGNRKAHPATRSISDVPNWINVLVGWSRRHEHTLADEGSVRPEHRLDCGDDLLRLGEPPFSDPAARQIPFARIDEPNSARGERIQIPPHRIVLE